MAAWLDNPDMSLCRAGALCYHRCIGHGTDGGLCPLRRLRYILLALLTLLPAGCATVNQPPKQPPPQPGAIFERARTAPLDRAALAQTLAQARLVLVGESHRHPGHHAIQAMVLELVTQGRDPRRVVLGVEWLDQTKQPACDELSAGRIDVDEFAKKVDWERVWGYDLELYRPILQMVRDKGLRLAALSAPLEVIRQIGRQGLASLEPSQRAAIAPALDLDDAAYRAQVAAQAPMHGQMSGGGLDDFFAAQVARDETMAHNMAAWLTPWPDGDAVGVVMVGVGHMAHGLGLPPRLARRLPGAPMVRVMPVEPDAADEISLLFQADQADVLIVSTPAPPRPPRLGVVLEPAPDGGLGVRAVLPGSAAEAAGLRAGDVLEAVDGKALRQAKDIHDAVKADPARQRVFDVRRGERLLRLKIGPRPL